MEKIATFTTDEARFLSNFYPHRKGGGLYPHPVSVIYNGLEFDCVENAYQAAKSLDKSIQIEIQAMTPNISKKYWDEREGIRADWKEVRLGIMTDLVAQKFYNSKPLQEMLLATGDTILEEGNDWDDVYWGICNEIGENHLGRILMQIRSDLRK